MKTPASIQKEQLMKDIEKTISKKNLQRFDSETYESSIKDNSKQTEYKNSIDFFPKNMVIEEPDESGYKKRKTTLEFNLKMKKCFVPRIKPIKGYVVPSKLRLNKIEFQDLNSKKNNRTCPNLDEEESDDNDNNSDNEIYYFYGKLNDKNTDEYLNKNEVVKDIKNVRINLKKIKNGNIPKKYSKKAVLKYDKELDLDDSSSSDLYDIDEINNYSLPKKNENSKDKKDKKDNDNNEEKMNFGRNRLNSWSILDILQKKFKLDDE